MSSCQPPRVDVADVLAMVRGMKPMRRIVAQKPRSTTREPVALRPDSEATLARGFLIAREPQCEACVDGYVPRVDGGLDLCACRFQLIAAQKLRAARIPADMIPAFDEPDQTVGRKAAIERLKSVIDGARLGDGRPDGITMHGDSRIGKSLLAAYVAVEFVKVGRSVRWATIDMVDEAVKDESYGQSMPIGSVLSAFIEAELLVVDEVKQRSEHAQRMIGRVIRARFETRRPTILTSNGTPSEIAQAFEPHIWLRLAELSPIVEVKGRRRASR